MSNKKKLATLLMLISFVLSVVSPAMANSWTPGTADGSLQTDNTNATGKYAVAMGYGTNSTGRYAVSMGHGTNASVDYAVAMGYESNASGQGAMAMGYRTIAEGTSSVAVGRKTIAKGPGSVAMGWETTAGAYYSTAMGYSSYAIGYASTAMGFGTNASGGVSTALGYHSEAHGSGAFAGGGYIRGDTPVEAGATAYGNSSFAFGNNAVAGSDTVISGTGTSSDPYFYEGANTVAFGSNARAVKDNTIAFGSLVSLSESEANKFYGGYAKKVLNNPSLNPDLYDEWASVLNDAKDVGKIDDAGIEALKTMSDEQVAAKMEELYADPDVWDWEGGFMEDLGYYDGVPTPDGTTATGENAIAIGNSSKVQGTLASGKNSMALGNDAQATVENALALGTSAQATHANSVALGSNSVTTAENTISVGYVGGERRITNVAAGVDDTDAVNVKQLNEAITGGGSGGAWTADVDGTSINVNADKPTLKFIKGEGITLEADAMSNSIKISATGGGSGSGAIAGGEIPDGASAAKANENGTAVASGYDSQANAENSVANGFASAVSPESNAGIAIGRGATVGYEGGDTSGADTAAISGIAIGEKATVTGANSIAIGAGHVISGKNSGAFGDPTYIDADEAYAIGNKNNITAEAQGSFIIGNNSTVSGKETFVVGSNVTTSAKNSVILGSGSTATEDNVVSVGSSDNQRRIVNVADGINPTDAANMRQLEAVSGEVREVGAISAALAGLHFVEPSGEGDDKLVGAVAYGGYRGESAAAIGVAYKPSPNLMLSASTSIGNSQNAYNAGVSYKFGKGETAQTKAELQKQVKFVNEQNIALKGTVAQQGAENAALKDRVGKLESEIEELKKLIKK